MKENLFFLGVSLAIITSLIIGMETGKQIQSFKDKEISLKEEIARKEKEIVRVQKERDFFKKTVQSFFENSCMEKDIFRITGYDLSYRSCGKWAKYRKTFSGTTPFPYRTVAVDPKIIPIGSLVYINGLGWFIAEDTGGAVKGKHIDVFFSNTKEAVLFGVKKAEVFYYNPMCVKRIIRKNVYKRELVQF